MGRASLDGGKAAGRQLRRKVWRVLAMSLLTRSVPSSGTASSATIVLTVLDRDGSEASSTSRGVALE